MALPFRLSTKKNTIYYIALKKLYILLKKNHIYKTIPFSFWTWITTSSILNIICPKIIGASCLFFFLLHIQNHKILLVFLTSVLFSTRFFSSINTCPSCPSSSAKCTLLVRVIILVSPSRYIEFWDLWDNSVKVFWFKFVSVSLIFGSSVCFNVWLIGMAESWWLIVIFHKQQ
jgi:hypothetical protein